MARIHIPALLQDLTHRATVEVEIPAQDTLTVGQVLERLDASFPGLRERLLYRGDLLPGIAVFVDGEQGFMKLQEKVRATSEVHFLPPIVGG
jgi:molybdopterin converting factor small subunit